MINSELVKTVDKESDDTIVSTVTYCDGKLKAGELVNYFHVVEATDVPIIPSIATMSCSYDTALNYDTTTSSYGYSDPVDGAYLDSDKIPDYVVTGKFYKQPNTITFTSTDHTEMLKIADDGFYVRGKKLEQDDEEAKLVYQGFLDWMKNQSIGSF